MVLVKNDAIGNCQDQQAAGGKCSEVPLSSQWPRRNSLLWWVLPVAPDRLQEQSMRRNARQLPRSSAIFRELGFSLFYLRLWNMHNSLLPCTFDLPAFLLSSFSYSPSHFPDSIVSPHSFFLTSPCPTKFFRRRWLPWQ